MPVQRSNAVLLSTSTVQYERAHTPVAHPHLHGEVKGNALPRGGSASASAKERASLSLGGIEVGRLRLRPGSGAGSGTGMP
jgi:hypothetical protein